MRKTKKILLALGMVSLGIGCVMYPVVSNFLAEKNASDVIQDYTDSVRGARQEELETWKRQAEEYNAKLYEDGNTPEAFWEPEETIGYITIPKIDVELPIYEGVGDDVLSSGVGHIENTSFPVGGVSTHSVLTGHRGFLDATLFSDLDKLETGDYFYLYVLDERLTYQVDQIKVVKPEMVDDLKIVEGKDYCTLVTCTPYAINTHRLLVRGTRVRDDAAETQDKTLAGRTYRILFLFILALLDCAGIVWIILYVRKKEEYEKKKSKTTGHPDDGGGTSAVGAALDESLSVSVRSGDEDSEF